ncbi:MAG TPA: hypothetical protein VFE36_07750 [Candidatus Baltobacteraceae bacterium]|jgi:hypothetical protein|nr:hypothetical protein [Candidatus Baltobacteraceae bacterium]
MLFALIPYVIADAAPIRHLVYSFTYESKQHGTVSNDPGSSGARTYTGNLADHGTITVDVMKEAPDRGLIVVVSEQGADTRSAASVTCAVYGNTLVACDPTKPTNSEELTLLRFLGANFVDPAKVDANSHWAISENPGPVTVKADYTITSNNDGVLTITESRTLEGHGFGSVKTDSQTKLTYDGRMQVPASVDEYATERKNSGIQGISTTVLQTTLKLVTDSLAAHTGGASP